MTKNDGTIAMPQEILYKIVLVFEIIDSNMGGMLKGIFKKLVRKNYYV